MAGTHALLSPSRSEQWINCPGSIQLTRDIPNPTSEYAAEGTVYHGIASEALERPLECAAWIGDTREADGFKFVIDAENAAFAQVYVDRMRARPGVHFVEVSVPLDNVLSVPDQNGTADHIAIDQPNRTIYVDDLKFGRGEVVYAPRNKQAMLYALGAVAKYARQFAFNGEWKVIIGIHQPRINHYDEWPTTVAELREFAETEAAPAAQIAYNLWDSSGTDAALKARKATDKGCRWCPLKSCTERANKMLHLFPIAAPEQIAAKRGQMTDAEVGEALMRLDGLEQWIAAIRTEALSRALNGAQFAGMKLAEGRKGARAFTDELIAEAALYGAIGDAAYKPRTILTPTEAEKQLKIKHPETWATLTEKYIRQSPGAKSLVRIEDDRPPTKIETPEFPIAPPAAQGLL